MNDKRAALPGISGQSSRFEKLKRNGTAAFTFWEMNLRRLAAQVARAASQPPFMEGAVFLATGSGLPEHKYNFNRPSTPAVLYLRDPGPVERADVVSRLGFHNWAVLRYDASNKIAYWEPSLPQQAEAIFPWERRRFASVAGRK